MEKHKRNGLLSTFFVSAMVLLLGVFFSGKISYASWLQEEEGIKYIQPDGQFAIGFVVIDENRYYFDSDGHLVTGKFYVEEEDAYYYSNEEGILQYGAIYTDNDFFLADEEGKLTTGFAEYEGERYYFNEIGQVVVGWFKNEDDWYYSDYSGKIMTGFVTVDGYRYYLNADGTRVKEAVLDIDGTTYIFNADGSVDENATVLYPVLEFINELRVQHNLPSLNMNSKVQACAIMRASQLMDGFSIPSSVSIEQLLTNRGVKCDGGFEFSYGGIAGYDRNRLMEDMQRDLNFQRVVLDATIKEVGIGMHQHEDIYYYDIILIKSLY